MKQTVYKLTINRHFILWRREAITNSYFCWYFNETQDVKIIKIFFVLLLLTLISCLYDLSFWKIRRQTSRDFQISSKSFQLSKNMCLVWRRRWSASKIFMRWGEDFCKFVVVAQKILKGSGGLLIWYINYERHSCGILYFAAGDQELLQATDPWRGNDGRKGIWLFCPVFIV